MVSHIKGELFYVLCALQVPRAKEIGDSSIAQMASVTVACGLRLQGKRPDKQTG